MAAKNPVRRSQLISPWGIGQMINFPKDESLMVVGLDPWEELFNTLSSADRKEFVVTEDRLARRLGVKDFRLPPDFRDPEPGIRNASLQIPFIRFPRWHYCTRCGHMEKVSIYSPRKPMCSGTAFTTGRSCSEIAATKRQRLIPVRFIAICPDGHIQDFPFMEWVHGSPVTGDGHQLRLRAGRSSGSLSGIEISCGCGAQKSMAGAFNEDALHRRGGVVCSGDRPWLGEEAERKNAEHCGQHLNVVQKGASNVYFADIRSSIYLPQWEKSVDRRLVEVLENNWGFLSQGMENGNFQRMRFELVTENFFSGQSKQEYTDKLLEAASRKLTESDSPELNSSEERFRKMEYDYILSEAGGENQDFYVTMKAASSYSDGEISGNIGKAFSGIGLLHKLRETRAFIGFSRWFPEDNKTLEQKRSFIKRGKNIGWLPAVVVKGEGVFFQFDEKRLKQWAERPDVINRVKNLVDRYNNVRRERNQQSRPVSPQFVLIHTFAHVIINQFSYECGYGSSSLRERIYCNLESPEAMHGVLVYTASGDSEGSLGGLVRQGNPGNLETIVYRAIENARWCSGDPICIDAMGQGPDSCNLAACHNCALLPETCCEEGNKLLDRALLIGELRNPEMGYFNFSG
jgi:hypothetical protein